MSMNDSKDKSGTINIKSKKKFITRKNILIILAVLLIAVITGVVSIKYVLSKLNVQQLDENNDINNIKTEIITEQNIKKAIGEVAPSLVSIGTSVENLESNKLPSTNSTGVIITKNGLIATSYSNIKDFKSIFVELPSKGFKPMKAILLGYNKDVDIALIKISANDLDPIKIANDKSIKAGNIVYAIGNSTSDSYVGLITQGIITSTIHSVKVGNSDYTAIQTSAIMNDENYGGVLCNSDGELIGINSKYLTNKYSKDHLFFSTGSEALKAVTSEIIKDSDVLGMRGSEVELSDEYKKGFYIESLSEKGKAAQAGLKPTDIILTANKKPILSYEDLIIVLKNSKKDNKIELKILRDGKIQKLYMTI